jgi:hypothetical protein
VELRFVPIGESEVETAALAELLSGNEWPFHGNSRPSRETVEGWLAAGSFTGSGVRSFWIRVAETDATSQASLRLAEAAVGVVTLRELADPSPVFDLCGNERDFEGQRAGTGVPR